MANVLGALFNRKGGKGLRVAESRYRVAIWYYGGKIVSGQREPSGPDIEMHYGRFGNSYYQFSREIDFTAPSLSEAKRRARQIVESLSRRARGVLWTPAGDAPIATYRNDLRP